MYRHLLTVLLFVSTFLPACAERYDVVVVGGGTSGVCAAVESARLGAGTLLIDPTPWLGGMLTQAGVSCTDGNFKLPSGLWGDFQQELVRHYGAFQALATGWVSMIQFEPSVGNAIFQKWVKAEKKLTYEPNATFKNLKRLDNGWEVTYLKDGKMQTATCAYVIDGTELGDAAKAAGLKYHIGLDARADTGEPEALAEASDIVQDMTYVVTLKFHKTPQTIRRPKGYNPQEFRNCCINPLNDSKTSQKPWSQQMMMTYGRLPGGKYMINWPMFGNDYYLNDVDFTPEKRLKAEKAAKAKTWRFLYFMQHELGMDTLGLAEEYPTEDGLPFIPYYREGRRFEGRVLFTLNDIRAPYEQQTKLYRTAVVVGDYPVDQHHNEMPVKDLQIPPIPSWGMPVGVFFPKTEDRMLLAEKAISVTNLVNGTSRLQPVSMQIGQVAGALAAMAVREGCLPKDLSVRAVQRQLLSSGNYLLPYLDVEKSSPRFACYQRIGVTGLLHGVGKHKDWKNEMWLEADSVLSGKDLRYFADFYGISDLDCSRATVSTNDVLRLIEKIWKGDSFDLSVNRVLQNFGIAPAEAITRGDYAVLVDQLLNPFEARDVDLEGEWK